MVQASILLEIHTCMRTFFFFLIAGLCFSCGERSSSEQSARSASGAASAADVPANPTRDVFFGHLHVHTSYSFDGYTNGSITEPADAYRWAQGEAIPGGGGGPDLQIKRPLDWYAVSDHAEYLGVFKLMEDPENALSELPIAAEITSDDQAVAFAAFARILDDMNGGVSDPQLSDPEVSRTVWQDVVETADQYYRPGSFTTFPAFEWTSAPSNRNLHRVVLFKHSDNVPALPYSTLDSDRPEDLWAYMENARNNGAEVLAVAHNGNASDGLMFPDETSYGGSTLNLDYAETRMRNEPVYELTQIKGTSETHPDLSPNDEFAGFELWDYTLAAITERATIRQGSYARKAWLDGLRLGAAGQGNPYRFGVIGDSDTHNSASPLEEDNYTGKFAFENNPEHRLEGPPGFEEANKQQVREFGSAGVAGVWAESNTREAIFEAIQRKETFATSGPRMHLRFFGGWGFSEGMLENGNWLEQAYAEGVPMGGDLANHSGDGAPTFLIQAMKEADGANLDRVQVIKGWTENGQSYERIYEVSWSGDRQLDGDGKLPAVGNTVDASDASYTNDIGATQLQTVWSDPDFDPAQPALYYVRVLQIPTPRWSTYDAVTLGVEPLESLPVSIQERAWSSPIWYNP